MATIVLLTCAQVLGATTCNLVNPSLSLGTYDPFNTIPTDSSTTIVVTCQRSGGPQNVTVTVAIGPSLYTGSVATRKAKHIFNVDLLGYNIYRDVSRTQVWGDSSGVNTVSQTISVPNKSSSTATFVLNARIDALQDPRVGDYSDSLQVSVLP